MMCPQSGANKQKDPDLTLGLLSLASGLVPVHPTKKRLTTWELGANSSVLLLCKGHL